MPKPPREYRHDDEALLRPEAGAQETFPPRKRKPPAAYRFDSSLAPELAWDESAARGQGERLLAAILGGNNGSADARPVAIEPAARKSIEDADKTLGIPATYAQASPDLAMSDLLKNTRSGEIFAVVGLPDVNLVKLPEKSTDGNALWQATLRGLDVFDPATMKTESRGGDDVPCRMPDTDYDEQCFRAGQVFFPRTAAWDTIRRAVKADFEDNVWDHLRGAVSAPFVAGERGAVKVSDDRGNELLVVKSTDV